MPEGQAARDNTMTMWRALAGGFAGTLVLTTSLRAASELGLTRMDLPFLLGSGLTANRLKAKALGYLLQFVFGIVFALVVRRAVLLHRGGPDGCSARDSGRCTRCSLAPSWSTCCFRSCIRGWATTFTAADSAPLLEPPGFMMLNYGRATPIISVLGHMAYGAVRWRVCAG